MSEIEERNHSLKQNTSWNTCRDTISHLYSLQQRSHEHNFAVLTDHEQLQTLSRLPASLRNVRASTTTVLALHDGRLTGVAAADQTALRIGGYPSGTGPATARRRSCGLPWLAGECLSRFHVRCQLLLLLLLQLTVNVVWNSAEKNAQRASVILFVINTKILSGSDKKVRAHNSVACSLIRFTHSLTHSFIRPTVSFRSTF